MKASILIPCYNAEKFIAQAIQSALDQTWGDKEVIVVDDGSTDGSLDVIRTFDGRIRWETGPNRGGNAARNRLLSLATGEWLQYLDADDYLLPSKIEDQIRFLSGSQSADVVLSTTLFELWQDPNRPEPLREYSIDGGEDPWVLLLNWSLPQTGGPLWRRESVIAAGGWDEKMPCCQEHSLYFRLLSHNSKFVYYGHSGAVYRYWSTGTVSRSNPDKLNETRLGLLAEIEAFLLKTGQMTPQRLHALNATRLLICRHWSSVNQEKSRQIMRTILASSPKFVPNAGFLYRALHRLLGMQLAEAIRDVGCRVRSSVNRRKKSLPVLLAAGGLSMLLEAGREFA